MHHLGAGHKLAYSGVAVTDCRAKAVNVDRAELVGGPAQGLADAASNALEDSVDLLGRDAASLLALLCPVAQLTSDPARDFGLVNHFLLLCHPE
jgi:hypothetical protein